MYKFRALLIPLCAFLFACADDDGVAPQIESSLQAHPAAAATAAAPIAGPSMAKVNGEGAVVASASGGADWILEVFGFIVPQTLGFRATKFADGTVRGHINYHQTFQGETFKFNATVTCVEVYDGNRVKFGGEITLSNDPVFTPGMFIWFTAIDNGEGADSPPDGSSGSGFGNNAENEAFCASPAPPNPLFFADVTHGNIQVDG